MQTYFPMVHCAISRNNIVVCFICITFGHITCSSSTLPDQRLLLHIQQCALIVLVLSIIYVIYAKRSLQTSKHVTSNTISDRWNTRPHYKLPGWTKPPAVTDMPVLEMFFVKFFSGSVDWRYSHLTVCWVTKSKRKHSAGLAGSWTHVSLITERRWLLNPSLALCSVDTACHRQHRQVQAACQFRLGFLRMKDTYSN